MISLPIRCAGNKAQVGIINSGGLRIGRIIPAGTFTPGDMLDLFPYGNKVILVLVTGAEIRKQLEVSASSIKADGTLMHL